MVLIKDNHLAALRNEKPNAIAAAVARARKKFPKLKVEVEADTLEQVAQAADAGADIILLDNMTPAQLRQAVKIVNGRAKTEASGGVNLENRPRHRRRPAWILFPSARSRIPPAPWTSVWILKNEE